LSAIFISGVTATPGIVNIIAIEKIIPENIGIAVGILFHSPQTPVIGWSSVLAICIYGPQSLLLDPLPLLVDTPDILARMSRGCYEETVYLEFQL